MRGDAAHVLQPPALREQRLGDAQHDLGADGDVELLAGSNYIGMILDAINEVPDVDNFLASLSDDLTSLLKDALDIWAAVEEADVRDDPGYTHQPSIKPHDQNRHYHSWTVLIDLVWRSWTRLDATSAEKSRSLVARWRSIPYLTFRRLSLQAIGESTHWTLHEKLDVLLNGT